MNNRKAIVLNDKSVKTIGRTYLYNDTLWAAFSGAGAEFIFTGKKLEITVTGDFASTAGNDENYARIAIYVDNERVVDDMLDEKEKTYKVLESEIDEMQSRIDELQNQQDYPPEIFQWYIVNGNGADIIKEYTDDPLYYNEALDMYLWGVTHYGTSWDYVLTDVKLNCGDDAWN